MELMMILNRSLPLVLNLMSAAVASALMVGPVTAQEKWDTTVQAAKREGVVVLYSTLQPNGIEPLLQMFREANPGIRTEEIRLGSNSLIERFSTEFSANRHLADLVITFPDDRVMEGMDKGWAMEWTPPEIGNFPASVNLRNMEFALQYVREAIIWNKTLVKKGQEPKEWADLFDPKWKGKIGMNPPWRSVALQQVVALWEDRLKLGDTAAKMQANAVRFFEGSGGTIQAVIRGDVAVAEISDIPLNPLLADGAPLGFRYPDSGTPYSANLGFVAKHAPHPNSAKILLNWLMSEDGQKALLHYGGLSVTRRDAPALSQLPATSQLANPIDGATLVNPERQTEIVSHWRTVFGIK
jgi:iron(III) transport system substrate-binding protein